MTACNASAIVLALALLVTPGVADTATPSPVPRAPAPASPAPAVPPPELQALEAKMAQLQVVRERFSGAISGSATGPTAAK
jgi:hypothetical protein